MTSDIREDLAQVIANSFFGMEAGEAGEAVVSSGDLQLAQDILASPLLDRIKREAAAEALEDWIQRLQLASENVGNLGLTISLAAVELDRIRSSDQPALHGRAAAKGARMSTHFKIGDKVRLTGRGWADFEPTHQGDIVEITAIFAGDAIFRDDEGFEWFVDDEPGSEWESTLVDA